MLIGAVEKNRTSDLRVTSALLYQLSYNGNLGGNGGIQNWPRSFEQFPLIYKWILYSA